MSLLRTQKQGHQPGFASRFSAALCIHFIHSFGSINAVPTVALPMNVYLRTRKHFETAVGFPVDFVIGRVQSGKVLSPKGCYIGKSLLAFTSECCPLRLCTLCTANTAFDLFILCFCCGSLGCTCA